MRRGEELLARAERRRLERPRRRGPVPRGWVVVDPEAFGRFTERVARFFGTGTYLTVQTAIVAGWVLVNLTAARLRWDPYPFILLNLAFSTQSAYAAPLILLAQNRQERRDRVALAEDRARAARTQQDTEFLARELAEMRHRLSELPTRSQLQREIPRVVNQAVNQAVTEALCREGPDPPPGGDPGR